MTDMSDLLISMSSTQIFNSQSAACSNQRGIQIFQNPMVNPINTEFTRQCGQRSRVMLNYEMVNHANVSLIPFIPIRSHEHETIAAFG